MPVSSRKRLALTVGSRLLLLLAACLILARHAASSEECAERGLDLQHPAVKAWHPPGEPGNLYQQCVSYRDVCFDQVRAGEMILHRRLQPPPAPELLLFHNDPQGTVVSFDPAHSPANASHVRLPRLDISKLSYTWGGEHLPVVVWRVGGVLVQARVGGVAGESHRTCCSLAPFSCTACPTAPS